MRAQYMNKTISFVILLAFIFFNTQTSFAKSKINRSFSFDIGYIPSIGANRAFWNFGHGIEDFASGAFDLISEKTFLGQNILTRTIWGFGMYWIWRFPQNGFFLSNHEFGHGSRVTAAGGSASYRFSNGGASHGNIFSYWLLSLGTSGGGSTSSTGGGSNAPTNWSSGAVTGGGVNNSAMMGEYLEDQMLHDRGHILSGYLYQKVKLDSYQYVNATLAGTSFSGSSGDMTNIVSHYSRLGHSISLKDIQFGGLAAFLTSVTTYSYIFSTFKYFASGDPSVKTPYLGNIQLPNVSHYLNMEGIAFKMRSSLKDGKNWFPFSIEFQYLGKTALEIGFGHHVLNGFSWDIFLNSLPAFGASGIYAKKIGSSSQLMIGGGIYQTTLFQGARVTQLNISDGIGLEAFLRYSLLY